MTIQKRYPIRTAGWPGSVRLDVRKVARSMALGYEIACSASHAKPTWPDESLKLDRQ
jgi:hypothetical protein